MSYSRKDKSASSSKSRHGTSRHSSSANPAADHSLPSQYLPDLYSGYVPWLPLAFCIPYRTANNFVPHTARNHSRMCTLRRPRVEARKEGGKKQRLYTYRIETFQADGETSVPLYRSDASLVEGPTEEDRRRDMEVYLSHITTPLDPVGSDDHAPHQDAWYPATQCRCPCGSHPLPQATYRLSGPDDVPTYPSTLSPIDEEQR